MANQPPSAPANTKSPLQPPEQAAAAHPQTEGAPAPEAWEGTAAAPQFWVWETWPREGQISVLAPVTQAWPWVSLQAQPS